MLEYPHNSLPYVLKLFPSKRKHQMRYSRNGYLVLPIRCERMYEHFKNTTAYGRPLPTFAMIVTDDKMKFRFYVCSQHDIGFSILGSYPWTTDLPIHVLCKFKVANECTNRVIDDFNFYTATDI